MGRLLKLIRGLSFLSMIVWLGGICLWAQAETQKSLSTLTLTAKLVDPEKKAAQKAATVEVTVTGVQMIDPASVGEKPAPGQGHLHYQVDNGFIVATTTSKLSFHGLSPGTHQIIVSLAANDHTPLGPKETLTLTVPSEKPAAQPSPAKQAVPPRPGY